MVRAVIWLVAVAALLAAFAIAVAGPGSRFGLWDYGTGFSIMRTTAPVAFALAGLSALGFVLSLWRSRETALIALLGALAAGGAGYAPLKVRQIAEAHPYIHDITTDFDNPPAIVAGAALPRNNPARYVGDEQAAREAEGVTVADAQRAAFADIAPLYLDASLEDAVARARDVIDGMNMRVLAEGPVGESASEGPGSGWRIEAAFTSLWFGFKDDFVVRLTPAGEGRVRVDARSKSRVGLSDLGANSARVRTFLERMKAPA